MERVIIRYRDEKIAAQSAWHEAIYFALIALYLHLEKFDATTRTKIIFFFQEIERIKMCKFYFLGFWEEFLFKVSRKWVSHFQATLHLQMQISFCCRVLLRKQLWKKIIRVNFSWRYVGNISRNLNNFSLFL